MPKLDHRCFTKLSVDGAPIPRYVVSMSPKTPVITRMRKKNNMIVVKLEKFKINKLLGESSKKFGFQGRSTSKL